MLIDKQADAACMAILIITFIVLVGPLALLLGADSRFDERLRLPEWRRN